MKREIRLYSSELFTVYDRVSKVSFGTTSLVVVSEKTGIKYHRLNYYFNSSKSSLYEGDSVIIIRTFTNMIYKGRQKGGFKDAT